jgi:ABC-2 type transport system permease protein
MNTMKMLVKREYWENKGGIFWAPVIVGAFYALMLVVGITIGIFSVKHGNGANFDGINVRDLSSHMTEENRLEAAHGLAVTYLPSVAPLLIVMAFVIFFYSLSSLYDDRKDKSILFWKSMPVSDSQTVFSKLFTILVVTPIVPLVIGFFIFIVLFCMIAIAAQSFGVNLAGPALGMSDLYLLPLQVLACLPIYILWAFPSVAWLMMVSAWAPRFPILWAVGIPIIIGVLLSFSAGITGINIPHEWYWENIVGRFFGGFVPGLWLAFFDVTSEVGIRNSSPGGWEIMQASWAILGYAKVWIAVAAGVVMTFASIRLRRYRDDG